MALLRYSTKSHYCAIIYLQYAYAHMSNHSATSTDRIKNSSIMEFNNYY